MKPFHSSKPKPPKDPHIFRSRPSSRTRKNSTDDLPANDFFLSPFNPGFSSNRGSPRESRSSFLTSNAINTIADFHNKRQVNKAIDLAKTVQNRVEVVDLILKRREEIRHMEDEMKLERAAPLIRKLSFNFKTRMKNKDNKMQKNMSQFKKSLFSLLTTENQDTLLTEKTYTKPSENLDKLNDYISIEQGKSHNTENPLTENMPNKYFMPRVVEHEPKEQALHTDHTIQLTHNCETDKPATPVQNAESKSENETLAHLQSKVFARPNSRAAKNKVALLFSKRTIHTETSTNGLALGEGQKDPLDAKNENKALNNKKSKYGQQRLISTSREFAKERFQKDLYEYLVKYEKEEDAQGVVLNLGQLTTPRIRNLEAKAKEKFESFVEKKQKSQNQTGSFEHKRFLSEVMSARTEQPAAPKPQEFKGLFRNNIKPRKPLSNSSTKQLQPLHMRKASEPLMDPDESFISYTETQLDHLYRNTHKINKTLKLLDTKLDVTKTSKQWKKLEKSKRNKLDDLYLTSGEIMKLTKRKLREEP